MKKIILLLLLINFTSCSPKLGSSILKTLPPLNEKALVIVLSQGDEQVINTELIGEIKVLDNGFSERCSYYEGVQNLKALARKAGANLVKITGNKAGDKWSSCHRFWANIYKVDNPKTYEKVIIWSKDRKLTWDDFKGKPDTTSIPNAAAITHSGFDLESSMTLFKSGKLFVQALFFTETSWVLPKGRNDYILAHEQIHFDISEIYSRILRKKLADANITSMASGKAKTIFTSVFGELERRQEKYDRETEHSINKKEQEKWKAIIEIELAKYELYKAD